jgi:hypothetical protein
MKSSEISKHLSEKKGKTLNIPSKSVIDNIAIGMVKVEFGQQ